MRNALSRLNTKGSRRALELAVGPILLVAVWWLAAKGGWVNKDLLPSPIETLRDTAANIWSGSMTRDFSRTLERAHSIESKATPAKKVDSLPRPPDFSLITDWPIMAHPAMPPMKPVARFAMP